MQEMQDTDIQSLGQEDTLKEKMAAHSVFFLEPWTEEQQSMGLQRVRHG